MARPAPDPERVVEVFELAFVKGYSYRRIVEWSKTAPGLAPDGISIGSVSEWVRQGHEWWAEVERLSLEQERSLQRIMLGKFMEWLEDAHDDQSITTADAIPLGLKILDHRAKVTGAYAPTRVRVEDDRPAIPAPPPAAVRAMEGVRNRVARQERRVIESDTA